MSNKTGGPAFPNVPPDVQYEQWDEPLTVRDYFAAKAMQSLYSRAGGSPAIDADSCDYCANHAYKMADAMLKARDE